MESPGSRRSRRLAGLSSGVEYAKSAHEFETSVTPTKPPTAHEAPSPAAPTPRKSEATEWRPDYPVTYAPLFALPPQAWALCKWLFGWPGYLWPWNVVYLTVCWVTFRYTNPECLGYDPRRIELGWVAMLYARNLGLLWLFSGGWHYLLYISRSQGMANKYDLRWPAVNTAKFWFNDQVTLAFVLTMGVCLSLLVTISHRW